MDKVANENEYRPRVIDSVIGEYLSIAGAICIEGPKWCGKTWTSSHHSRSEFLVGDPRNGFSNRQLAELNPVMILQGDTPRMIDEWQEAPAIWDAVRAEIDRRHKKGQLILTGSSTPRAKGVMHSGTGRIVCLRMNTMSLFESGDSTGAVSLRQLCEGSLDMQMVKETSLEDLAWFIVRGGFPDNISVPRGSACLMPRAYMDGVIKEDLNKLDDGMEYNQQKVRLLLKSLARNEATTASDSSLLKDMSAADDDSLSRNTVAKYLAALGRLFLFNNQEPFSPNIRSRLRVKQSEKRHFSDPAMAAAMLHLTPEKLRAI